MLILRQSRVYIAQGMIQLRVEWCDRFGHQRPHFGRGHSLFAGTIRREGDPAAIVLGIIVELFLHGA